MWGSLSVIKWFSEIHGESLNNRPNCDVNNGAFSMVGEHIADIHPQNEALGELRLRKALQQYKKACFASRSEQYKYVYP